jgi:probable HAF family extracellular repeat protein
MRRFAFGIAFAGILGGAHAAPAAWLRGVGDLEGGIFASSATAISTNGRVVVGSSRSLDGGEAFHWVDGVMTGLGDLDGGKFGSRANAVSADGTVVVGVSASVNGDFEAFRWADGVMTGLGDLPLGPFESDARGISANGRVIAGTCAGASSSLGCYWSDGVLNSINQLLGKTGGSGALAISADGLVIVGGSGTGPGAEAFLAELGATAGLGALDGGFPSKARAVSADGSVVVGSSASSTATSEAFRWQNGVMVGLGDLAGGDFASSALAVSADGSVIAGVSKTALGDEAFYWRADTGMQRLKDILDNASVDTEGWILSGAQGISADGLTIVGAGIDPLGREQGWIAFVPEPDEFAAGAVSALAVIGLGWRDRRRAARARRAPDSLAPG